MTSHQIRPTGAAWVFAFAAIAVLAIGTSAHAQHRVHRPSGHAVHHPHTHYPVAPGELGRLFDRHIDFIYRNSNRNVFRSSRHASPLDNPFRSSRHYEQKLAASYDGYPVRTYNRYTVGTGDAARERVESFAHHGHRYPASLYPAPPLGYADEAYPGSAPAARPIETAPRPRTREEIPMEPIRLVPPRPQREVIMEIETLPDGTTRSVIRNVEVEPDADAEATDADDG